MGYDLRSKTKPVAVGVKVSQNKDQTKRRFKLQFDKYAKVELKRQLQENKKASDQKVSDENIVVEAYKKHCGIPDVQVITVVLKDSFLKHGHFSFNRASKSHDSEDLLKYKCSCAGAECQVHITIPRCAEDGKIPAIVNHFEHNHSADFGEFNDKGVSVHFVSLANSMQTLLDAKVKINFQRQIGTGQIRNKGEGVKKAAALFNKALQLNEIFEKKFKKKEGSCTVYSYSRGGINTEASFVAKADGTIYIGF